MSLTRKLHTETTQSHAAQQMHSTMGLDPNLSQLNDRQLDNELTSRRADSADQDGLLKPDESDEVLGEAEAFAENQADPAADQRNKDIEESRSASWGQPSAVDSETTRLNAQQQANDADLTEGQA